MKYFNEKNSLRIAASSSFVPKNNLSSRIPTNRSLRRIGGMKDLPLAAEMYVRKMCIKISPPGRVLKRLLLHKYRELEFGVTVIQFFLIYSNYLISKVLEPPLGGRGQK